VRDFYENEEEPEINQTSSPAAAETNQPLNSALPKTDRLAKFQERQAKAQQIQAKKEEAK
jgi:hypothetical protein